MGEKNRPIQYDELALNLYKNTMTGEWKKVVETYEQHKLSAIDARINKSGDTAFHVAVSIAPEEKVQQLVRVITGVSELGLWTKNNKGNTPLHVAASTGRLNICILLAKAPQDLDIEDLVIKDLFRNNVGESPLFLAAFHGYKPIFLYLHLLLLKASDTDIKSIDPAYRRNDGETALHCAIRWEYFDVAYEMLLKEPSLAYAVNEVGITPLHLLASKPSVFKSGSHLGWWKSTIYHLIERCKVFSQKKERCKAQTADVESPKPNVSNVTDQSVQKDSTESLHQFLRRHYEGCFTIFHLLYTIFIRVILGLGYEGIRSRKRKHVYSVQIMKILMESTSKEAKSDFTSGTNPHQTINLQDWIREGSPPPFLDNTTEHGNKRNETAFTLEVTIKKETALEEKKDGTGKGETPKMANADTTLLILLPRKGETPEMKKTEAPILVAVRNGITNMVEQILQKLPMAINDKSKEKTETTILLAARNGITEIVEYILNKFPLAIDDKSEGQNIVLLAAKNRQTHVLQLLLEQEFVKRKLIHEVDSDENNALHLAAQIGKQRPWLIPGAALQMQWEIKWYEFVKDNMPQHFCYQVNKEGKTPEEIFSETHEDLVKQGGEWLNKTSESCSVVAALIATVAFASSTTIPGNINEENGKPNLESHSMLTVFAASSLIALCFSITALFSFLAILTSRYEQKDFRRDLPKKLLLGLTSLLVSITSMLVSFCAGHYFMLKNKLKDKAFPVYAATSLPIIFFAIQQLPLYIDIVWASFKNVPRSSYKAISL